ncbi:MAG TPA: dienelactone hydrolase family protein [Phototrophicaceae bacterium]|nr:dienelactone hydrolase family protein [Phototrophicaceae bacterium]
MPQHVEYSIVNGRISIVADDGSQLPAYWSHPDLGGKFPAIAILHDWWGITAVERQMAHLFAQMGYYVIVPDLFDGVVTHNPAEAYNLVQSKGSRSYSYVDTALRVIEHHLRTNGRTAAVGLGMGGSLAFEAALVRSDLDAAISLYGFPQRYLGKFKDAKAPILALYGDRDPFISAAVIDQLKRELAQSPRGHEVDLLPNVARDFFSADLIPNGTTPASVAWQTMTAFLAKHQVVPNPHDNAPIL